MKAISLGTGRAICQLTSQLREWLVGEQIESVPIVDLSIESFPIQLVGT